MTSDQSDTVHAARCRVLEHIEIHEDAILVTQNNIQPSATGLETDLNDLTLNQRKPLAEIQLRGEKTQEREIEGIHSSDKTQATICSADITNKVASARSSRLQPLLPLDHNIDLLNTQSPSDYNNHHDHIAVDAKSTNDKKLTSMIAKSPSTSQYRHMVLTPTRRSIMDANAHSPVIEISKRQQGQGDLNANSEQKINDNTPVVTPNPTLRAIANMNSPASKRSFSNKENLEPDGMNTPVRGSSSYDALEAAVVHAATPPTGSRPQSSGHSTSENAIAALDELDEAIDEVSKHISEVPASPARNVEKVTPEVTVLPQQAAEVLMKSPMPDLGDVSSPVQDAMKMHASTQDAEKLHSPTQNVMDTQSPVQTTNSIETIPQSKVKKAPVVRTTKATQARISLAHGPKDAPKAPAWGRPRDSIAKSSTLRQSFVPGQRSTSGASAVSSSEDEKKEVVIPHSKPRPMSMSFPVPPPPPKSTKAPTRPTFALPGEAVAAKLKAARQEREKKEDESKVFKARPVPAAIKVAPNVRQTNTSRARESLGTTTVPQKPSLGAVHRRASSVAHTRPADKRQSMSLRPSSRDTKFDIATIKESEISRPSTSLANISKPRVASPADVARTTTSQGRPAKTAKGHEVFSRTAFLNDAAEREKRAKEEATRKARADAAERSRQLSREWAEKQRREKLGDKSEVKVELATT